MKLPRNPKHDPRNKVSGKCPIQDEFCTDITGSHHSYIESGIDQFEIIRKATKKYGHVTRIETFYTHRPEAQIIEDFLKIKKHLGLPDKLELHIKFDWNEGFYRTKIPAVMIGIKGGYSRKLLVHECLHVAGYEHYEPADFSGDVGTDFFSERIEREIFGE